MVHVCLPEGLAASLYHGRIKALHSTARATSPAARKMAPYMSNSNTSDSQSAGPQKHDLLDRIQRHKLPHASSGYNLEPQPSSGNGQLDSDLYFAGFLDGIAAANAKYAKYERYIGE